MISHTALHYKRHKTPAYDIVKSYVTDSVCEIDMHSITALRHIPVGFCTTVRCILAAYKLQMHSDVKPGDSVFASRSLETVFLGLGLEV